MKRTRHARPPSTVGPPQLRALPGGGRSAHGPRRSRIGDRVVTVNLLRLESADEHSLGFIALEGERARRPWMFGPPRRHPGRLKTAAPHALTRTEPSTSAQKTRVKGRLPSDSSTIKKGV